MLSHAKSAHRSTSRSTSCSINRAAATAANSGRSGDSPLAIRSALTKFRTRAPFGRSPWRMSSSPHHSGRRSAGSAVGVPAVSPPSPLSYSSAAPQALQVYARALMVALSMESWGPSSAADPDNPTKPASSSAVPADASRSYTPPGSHSAPDAQAAARSRPDASPAR